MIDGVFTVFYYDDVRAAITFYEQVIGWPKTADYGWSAIFEVRPRTYLVLVNATGGSQKPIPGTNKGAILSLAIHDLEARFERLKRAGAVPADGAIEAGCGGRTREFKVRDPGGYTVEFCTWLTPLA
jgi:predicted enzyme related to lactoylglutathione lyase